MRLNGEKSQSNSALSIMRLSIKVAIPLFFVLAAVVADDTFEDRFDYDDMDRHSIRYTSPTKKFGPTYVAVFRNYGTKNSSKSFHQSFYFKLNAQKQKVFVVCPVNSMGDIRMFSVKKEGGRTITSDIKGFKTDISGTPELLSVSFNQLLQCSLALIFTLLVAS